MARRVGPYAPIVAHAAAILTADLPAWAANGGRSIVLKMDRGRLRLSVESRLEGGEGARVWSVSRTFTADATDGELRYEMDKLNRAMCGYVEDATTQGASDGDGHGETEVRDAGR